MAGAFHSRGGGLAPKGRGHPAGTPRLEGTKRPKAQALHHVTQGGDVKGAVLRQRRPKDT